MSFTWQSPVFFDELDLNGTLHNTRFALHVERAQSALFEQLGKGWTSYADRDADLHYVVKELHVEFLAPFTAPGDLPVTLSADHLGTSSARWGFECGHPDHVYARGHRVVIKVDPTTGRPTPWSDWFRQEFEKIGGSTT